MNDPMQRIKTENYRMGRYMVKYIADKGCVSRIYNILDTHQYSLVKKKEQFNQKVGKHEEIFH